MNHRSRTTPRHVRRTGDPRHATHDPSPAMTSVTEGAFVAVTAAALVATVVLVGVATGQNEPTTATPAITVVTR